MKISLLIKKPDTGSIIMYEGYGFDEIITFLVVIDLDGAIGKRARAFMTGGVRPDWNVTLRDDDFLVGTKNSTIKLTQPMAMPVSIPSMLQRRIPSAMIVFIEPYRRKSPITTGMPQNAK